MASTPAVCIASWTVSSHNLIAVYFRAWKACLWQWFWVGRGAYRFFVPKIWNCSWTTEVLVWHWSKAALVWCLGAMPCSLNRFGTSMWRIITPRGLMLDRVGFEALIPSVLASERRVQWRYSQRKLKTLLRCGNRVFRLKHAEFERRAGLPTGRWAFCKSVYLMLFLFFPVIVAPLHAVPAFHLKGL